ncbi:hypothetical protein CHLRE_17g721800v5 [Chlamydomonas reinhardtii]|uniref:Uncharacterized protein n=1 Tax=Chlamydomonas reinhardtii TaxID=3055 RepID=A0A2K3CQD9_CHLRE|nr:uncharacterized protein CHLRE_17g721800v5 [Chlamydomonas reinhardtii]PNW70483.1 hypothetical protein CHLRE_17g721800v5 [Chlamydomonas reinhardtii]
MGKHRLPAIANRLRLNRGFDSAWFAEPGQYAKMLQRDWQVTKNAWSFVLRSSRSAPRSNKDDGAAAAAAADPTRPRYPKKPQPQQQDARDFPNFRPARVFSQHVPYKSIVSVFAYQAPKEGPQAKYGLFQADRPKPPPRGGSSGAGAGDAGRAGGAAAGGAE